MELAGPRVALRPLTDADLPLIEALFAEAAAAARGDAGGPRPQIAEARSSGRGELLVIHRRGDPAPAGLLDYRVDAPEAGWAAIHFVAVGGPQRGRGYGSEAVRLVEDELARRWRTRGFTAVVDVRNGLGLYFWLRLGYRPLAPGQEPWSPSDWRGIIWMIRQEEQGRRTERP